MWNILEKNICDSFFGTPKCQRVFVFAIEMLDFVRSRTPKGLAALLVHTNSNDASDNFHLRNYSFHRTVPPTGKPE